MPVETVDHLQRQPVWQTCLAWILPTMFVAGLLFAAFPPEGMVIVQAIAVPVGLPGAILWRLFSTPDEPC